LTPFTEFTHPTGGEASVVSPKGRDWRKRNREFVIIAYAAREYVGWTAAHGDRGDLREAELALTELAQDRWERQRLRTDLRRQARELVAKPTFRTRARRVAKALAASGELNAYELAELLGRGEFRFEPAANLRDIPIRA
jgi:hypothetical protein